MPTVNSSPGNCDDDPENPTDQDLSGFGNSIVLDKQFANTGGIGGTCYTQYTYEETGDWFTLCENPGENSPVRARLTYAKIDLSRVGGTQNYVSGTIRWEIECVDEETYTLELTFDDSETADLPDCASQWWDVQEGSMSLGSNAYCFSTLPWESVTITPV